MEKLEPKHIYPYGPYDLQFKDPETVAPGVMVAIVAGMPGLLFYEEKDEIEYFDLSRVKPLLIPLSALMNNPEETGLANQFTSALLQLGVILTEDFLFKNLIVRLKELEVMNRMYYHVFQSLVEKHYDVFFLIDAGLALNKLDYIK